MVGVLKKGNRVETIPSIIVHLQSTGRYKGNLSNVWKKRLKVGIELCTNAFASSSNTPPATPSAVPTEISTTVATPSPSPSPTPTFTHVLTPTWSGFDGGSNINTAVAFGNSWNLPTTADFDETRAIVLSHLNTARPRVLVSASRLAEVQSALTLASDPTLSDYYNRVVLNAKYNVVGNNPSIPSCDPSNAQAMLTWVRARLYRINYSTSVYLINVGITSAFRSQLLQVAKDEINALVTCPQYFVDDNVAHVPAEAFYALSLAYDRLYDVLSPAERGAIETAAHDKAMVPFLNYYVTGAKSPWNFDDGEVPRFGLYSGGNILGVASGGLAASLMAFVDRYPNEVSDLLTYSRINIVQGLSRTFQNGSGFFEGPDYYEYLLNYLVPASTSLTNVLGTDFGISAIPGLYNSGRYYLALNGISGTRFNPGDATITKPRGFSGLFFLSNWGSDPLYASYAKDRFVETGVDGAWTRREPEDVFLYTPSNNEWRNIPNTSVFPGVHQFVSYSSFTDPNAMVIGAFGGHNRWNHNDQLGLTNIQLRAEGETFLIDKGYGVSGTANHSVLSFGGRDQLDNDRAGIIKYSDKPGDSFVELIGYFGDPTIQSYVRGIRLIGSRSSLLQDEFSLTTPTPVTWRIITDASVSLTGANAVLNKNGKQLKVRVIEPLGAILEAKATSLGGDASGATSLEFTTNAQSGENRIRVMFQSGSDLNRSDILPLERLTDWKN